MQIENANMNNLIFQMKTQTKSLESENEKTQLDLKKMDNQNAQIKKKVESLNQILYSFNTNVIARLNHFDLNIKNIKEIIEKVMLDNSPNNYQLQKINDVLEILNKMKKMAIL